MGASGGGCGLEAAFSQLPVAQMLCELFLQRLSLVLYAGGGAIYVERGEIIHATAGELQGVAALTQIIAQRSATVHTGPLPAITRTIFSPLRDLLEHAISAGESYAPLTAGKPPGSQRPVSSLERIHSVSYGALQGSELTPTPTVITRVLAAGSTTPSAAIRPLDTRVLQPSGWERAATPMVPVVVLSVVATLCIAVGLLYLFWPQEQIIRVVPGASAPRLASPSPAAPTLSASHAPELRPSAAVPSASSKLVAESELDRARPATMAVGDDGGPMVARAGGRHPRVSAIPPTVSPSRRATEQTHPAAEPASEPVAPVSSTSHAAASTPSLGLVGDEVTPSLGTLD